MVRDHFSGTSPCPQRAKARVTGNILPGIDLRDTSLPVGAVISHLDLAPHPEGGFYRETWRAAASGPGEREAGTAILFLLAAGQRSHWHRVDASELWLWQGGAPLHLHLSEDGSSTTRLRIGPDLSQGETLQGVVRPHAWQAAESLGNWSLVSCIVAPAFRFEGFELAPPGWQPG
ncbi:Cupin superfamily protein [Granulibacter bethesdensis]|nr:Cupin superfamily protein [Granulibacter bethesdensis]